MKLVLLITIMFTLALVHGHNTKPCEKNKENNAYNQFVKKHIVEKFPATNAEWQKYIASSGLCDRPKQSFFERGSEKALKDICQGKGHQLSGHLCISPKPLPFHYVEVNVANCEVQHVVPTTEKLVIVACDKVDNQCLPVHFEKYDNQQADPKAKPCQ